MVDREFNTEQNANTGNVEYSDKIVSINRVAKVVKGGKRFGFSVLVVVGDKKGKVGIGLGKSVEVPEAIAKATDKAKKSMFTVPVYNGTIPYDIIGRFGAARVVMKPAGEGTGIIAGGATRALLEVAGYKNILSKSLSSNNPHNVIKAVVNGLLSLKDPEAYIKTRGKASTAEVTKN